MRPGDAEPGEWTVEFRVGDGSKGWPEAAPFDAILCAAAARDERDRAIIAAYDAGLEPSSDEVLSFKQPPTLGGAFDVANLQTIEFAAALRAAGQLHQGIKAQSPS